MSLFKVRDFWTFDLEALKLQTGETTGSSTQFDLEEACHEGSFTSSIGRFNSIGQQDVFVCGDLRGILYIVQVPITDQQKYTKERVTSHEGESTFASSSQSPPTGSSSSSSSLNIDDRQLLAATNLGLPIVDIKCGYFTSALKQTIAILSFDKLLILHVKRLKSSDPSGEGSSTRFDGMQEGGQIWPQLMIINENLLSHEFEEYCRIDLMSERFACSLLALNSHLEGSFSEVTQKSSHAELDNSSAIASGGQRRPDEEGNKFASRSRMVVRQLHLPQRDKLIVQYVNQFLFTLVDGKKVLGHYSVQADLDAESNDPKMHQVSQCVGSMPMAYLCGNRSAPSLVLSFSDYSIHCVPLDKLIGQAKQDIMRRVALNLLQSSKSSNNLVTVEEKDSYALTRGGEQLKGITSLDIGSLASWTQKLIAMPVQMLSLQRKAQSASSGNKEELTVSQLLIMSRYNLDLFTACGQHLWSQRFEAPLIHSSAYVLDSNRLDERDCHEESQVVRINDGKQKVKFRDDLISLVCADSLTAGKSNLMILKEDRLQWSALLNAKPLKIWRLNLAHMSGLLAMLDVKQNHLIASYLGTNPASHSDADQLMPSETGDTIGDISKLELLNELAASLGSADGEDLMSVDSVRVPGGALEMAQEAQRNRLLFEVSLDASGKWPEVCVDTCVQLRMEPKSTGVLHDIVATLEYDDLLRFDLVPGDDQSITMISFPAKGVARIQLGNCWPDRREPICLRGQFNLLSTTKSTNGAKGLNELDRDNEPDCKSYCDGSNLVPKSLKVSVLLSYNETHSSLLVQEEWFLLPISMISQLIHVDYTNGNGQNLDDVLNNLGQCVNNKRASEKSSQSKPSSCDLFLALNCDLIGLLDEFVERDLVCRGSNWRARKRASQGNNKLERQSETLENINLLAQSLDCRLRYKNPLGRQSSEELIMPVVASFALRFHNIYSNLDGQPRSQASAGDLERSEDVVWIHICTLDSSESTITEEMVMRHMKDWAKYAADEADQEPLTAAGQDGMLRGAETHRLLVSIECSRALPLILMTDHLLERVRNLTNFDSRLATQSIRSNKFETYDVFRETLEKSYHRLALSAALQNSLKSLASLYKTQHGSRVKHLKDKLDQEYCKLHVATAAILSLCKRLPSLPDDSGELLRNISAVVKHRQKSMMDTLNELALLKEVDYQFSKLPSVPVIGLASLGGDHDGERIRPIFGQIID